MPGLLGDIFSAGNVARRKLTDLLGNPLLSAQQFVGNLNDRARVLNEMTSAAAQEGVNYGPASKQLAGLLAEAYNPIGMMVYHGSPAKFSRFDPTKIGSGEGAQAYGYGHYVAEAPGVAKDYQRRLAKEAQATDLNTKMQMVDVGGKPLSSFNVDMDAALVDAAKSGKKEFINLAENKKARWENLAQDQSYPFQDYAKQKAGAYTSLLDTAKKADVDYTGTGMFYEIDLPDEQIARMLDWDKPLSKQKDVMAALNNVAENNVKAKVRNEIENQIRASGVLPAEQTGDDYMSLLFGQSEETIAKANQMLKQLADEQMAKIDFAPLVKSELEGMKPPTMTWDATGKEFYEMLAQRRGSPEAASTLFREQGIPGIRYLDEGSRGRGEGTSNFVVFPGNEGLLTIQKRNNEVIAPTSLLDKSPQSEALLTAQRNAAKPISEGGLGLPPDNTAMDRAKAMGFRTKDKLYHGTPEQDIKEFVPTPHDETAILGTSLTSDPTIAEFYARGRGFSEQEGANILPVMIRGKKPLDFEKFTDYLINKNLLDDKTRQLTPEAKKYLESKGISGFDMSSLYGDEVQVVDPSRIRSIFAAFDPARRNEADILAGVLPLSLLADEEQRKKADAYFRSLLGQ